MSWAKIVKKNNKEFEKVLKKEEKIIEIVEDYIDPCYKDPEDEFEYKYSRIVTEIMIEFDDFLRKDYLPFNDKCVLDKTFDPHYTFHDFVRIHSKKYKNVCKYVKDYNNQIDREIEEENKKIEEEEAAENDI